jgi:hypothetical protein
MSRQDSSAGFPSFNYVQAVAVTSETALLAPSASGVSPYFPSPDFPLSTTTYPVGVYVGVPADIAGAVYDGHPFEVSLSFVASSTATTNMLVNLYQAKQSTFSGGPAATGYTLATLGSGCTKVVTGTATAGLTSTVSQNFWMKASFVWDSVSGKLGYCLATQYQSGAAPAIASSASVTGPLAITDLNFIPSFTFASAATTTITFKEFVINRL